MNYLTQTQPDPFGLVEPPSPLKNFNTLEGGGGGQLLTIILRLMLIIGGLYALINLLLAGYAFLSAGDDPKKIQGAWSKIYMTLIGLAVMAGSFVLAALFGQLLFGNSDALLNPLIPTIR
jgi:hypothetical protein